MPQFSNPHHCKADLRHCKTRLQYCKAHLQYCKAHPQHCKGHLHRCKGHLNRCKGQLPQCKADLQGYKADLQDCKTDLQVIFFAAVPSDVRKCSAFPQPFSTTFEATPPFSRRSHTVREKVFPASRRCRRTSGGTAAKTKIRHNQKRRKVTLHATLRLFHSPQNKINVKQQIAPIFYKSAVRRPSSNLSNLR